jgi:tetratricopeptide (TPR) repeat protein
MPMTTPITAPFRASCLQWRITFGSMLVLLCVLGVVFFAIHTGFGGSWQFDDQQNLKGLSQVEASHSVWLFLFGGDAGTLGRPVALASFLLNLNDWPQDPDAFRHISLLLHLLNGLLLAWLVVRIGQLSSWSAPRTLTAMVIITGLWLSAPLHVSGLLMPIQRMTILAGTWVLLGLLCYLIGRSALHTGRWWLGFTWMSVGMIVGAGLGAFTKENAILILVLVLIMNGLILPKPTLSRTHQRYWQLWQGVFLIAPVLLLCGYFWLTWDQVLLGYHYRPFDLSERLASETTILWDYLRQLFIPDISAFGPYQDDAPIRQWSQWPVIIATSAWGILLASALYLRRRYPWFLFAVLWFIAGHLLESSFISLELAFEHRNYIPALGPIAALTALLMQIPRRKLRWFAISIVMIVSVGLQWRVASPWHNDILAAEVWAYGHPQSIRATQFVAYAYQRAGFWTAARDILDDQAAALDGEVILSIQALLLSCQLQDPAEQIQARLTTILPQLSTEIPYGSTIVFLIHQLGTYVEEDTCPGIEHDDVTTMVQLALNNPQFRYKRAIRQHLYYELVKQAQRREDQQAALDYIEQAFKAYPSLSMARQRALLYFQAQQTEQALASIEDALAKAPRFGFSRLAWYQELTSLQQALRDVHQQLQYNTTGSTDEVSW